MKLKTKRCIAIIITITLPLFCVFTSLYAQGYKYVPKRSVSDSLTAILAIPDPLDPIIYRLAGCESSYHDDIVILDVNGKDSFGYLMFQQDTFDSYGNKYDLPHDNIMDKDEQIAIAKKMLRENSGWMNWKNCGLKIGIQQNLEVIE